MGLGLEKAHLFLINRKQAHRFRNSGAGEWFFIICVYVFLTLAFILVLYPMVFVISASFSDPTLVASGKMILWPVGFTLKGYYHILHYSDIWLGYGNSIFYTFVGTALNIATTLSCAYALSRKDLAGRRLLLILFIITMYFSGGLIPTYLNYLSFDLVNKRSILLINGLVSAYNIIVCRTFFATTIPWELQESAVIDGCGDFKIFRKIVLPLSMPIVVVMTLYYGVGHWNSYFTEMIYLKDRNLFPLQLFLREILVQSKLSESALLGAASPEEATYLLKEANFANLMKYAVVVISTAPMMLVYPWMQKFFAKGIMIGSLKG